MSRLNLRSLFIKPTQIPLQLLPTNHLPTELTLLRCCSGKMFLLGLCEKSISFVIFFFFFVNTSNANLSSLTKRRPAMISYVAVFKLMFSIMLTCDVSNDKQLFCTECQTFTLFLCSCFYVPTFLVDLGLQKKTNPDPTVGWLKLDVKVKCLYDVFSSEGMSDSDTARWIWNLFCDVFHDFNI